MGSQNLSCKNVALFMLYKWHGCQETLYIPPLLSTVEALYIYMGTKGN